MTSPKMTANDIGWTLLFITLFLPLTLGGMFVAGAYIAPTVLGSPNSVPRYGFEMFIELGLLFGGMIFGMCTAVIIFSFLTRNFLSRESHQRWVLQLKENEHGLPSWYLNLALSLLKYLQPQSQDNAL